MYEPTSSDAKPRPAIPAAIAAGLVLIGTLFFLAVYMGAIVAAFRGDQQDAAGARHLAGIATTNPGQPASPQQ